MKIIIVLLLLTAHAFAYAGRIDELKALRHDLSSVNSMRKAERQKAEDIYAQFERGEVSEEFANRSYDEIDARVQRLNEQKASIEAEIARVKSAPEESPKAIPKPNPAMPVPIEKPPERPPTPWLANAIGAVFDWIVTAFLWVVGIVLALGTCMLIYEAASKKIASRSRASTIQPTSALRRNQPQAQPRKVNTVRPMGMHSGNIPSNLL